MKVATPTSTVGPVPGFLSTLLGTWSYADAGKYVFSLDGTYEYFRIEIGPDSYVEQLAEIPSLYQVYAWCKLDN